MVNNYLDLIETNGNSTSYKDLPAKPVEEIKAFSAQNKELMDNWGIFRRVRNAAYEHLMEERRYLSQERRIEKAGRASCVEQADAAVKHYGGRYSNLTELSWLISVAYRQCDGAVMSGLLAMFMDAYRKEVEIYA